MNARLARMLLLLALASTPAAAGTTDAAAAKVLIVDSDHHTPGWSVGFADGALGVLEAAGVTTRIARLDTRAHEEAFRLAGGLRIKAQIETWRPDVVIAAGDGARRYVIEPHYSAGRRPIVLAGIGPAHPDPAATLEPAARVEHMPPMRELIETLAHHAPGTRVGLLARGSSAERRAVDLCISELGLTYERVEHVADFEAWRRSFVELQDRVDLLVLGDGKHLRGWDPEAAQAFVRANTRIPIGTVTPGMMPYAMVGYFADPRAEGARAATAALRILHNGGPQRVAAAGASVHVNLSLADQAGIVLDDGLIRGARRIAR